MEYVADAVERLAEIVVLLLRRIAPDEAGGQRGFEPDPACSERFLFRRAADRPEPLLEADHLLAEPEDFVGAPVVRHGALLFPRWTVTTGQPKRRRHRTSSSRTRCSGLS